MGRKMIPSGKIAWKKRRTEWAKRISKQYQHCVRLHFNDVRLYGEKREWLYQKGSRMRFSIARCVRTFLSNSCCRCRSRSLACILIKFGWFWLCELVSVSLSSFDEGYRFPIHFTSWFPSKRYNGFEHWIKLLGFVSIFDNVINYSK